MRFLILDNKIIIFENEKVHYHGSFFYIGPRKSLTTYEVYLEKPYCGYSSWSYVCLGFFAQESTITPSTCTRLGSSSGISAPAPSNSQKPLRNAPVKTSCGPTSRKVTSASRRILMMLCCELWVNSVCVCCFQARGRSVCPRLTRSAGSWWRPAGTQTLPRDPCWASSSPACKASWTACATILTKRAAAWRTRTDTHSLHAPLETLKESRLFCVCNNGGLLLVCPWTNLITRVIFSHGSSRIEFYM